jgi:preprotein translocase subunit YajC
MDILIAAAQPGQNSGGIVAFVPFILIMFIIYFLMIRPQTKRQKEKELMRESLKKGDKIITMGGIHGSVQGFKQKNKLVVVKVDNNTNLTLSRTAITGLAGKISNEELEQS